MLRSKAPQPRRVLIASSHALFGQGLRRLLEERRATGVRVVRMVSSLEQALKALDELHPDLVVVDYDDENLNREEFLARFVESEHKLRVVLLSLQSAQDAIVYDRRTLAAAQIDDWLEDWTYTDEPSRTNTGLAEHGSNFILRRVGMKNRLPKAAHLVIAGILVAVVSALLIFSMRFIRLLPAAASAQAVPIDYLFDLEFKVIAVLFSLIVVFMVYSILVFRRRKGDLEDAEHIDGSSKLEVAWTAAPLALVMAFAYLGSTNLAQTVAAEPQALRVEVIGRQWAWSFVYPDSGVISDKLYLPQDRQALLLLRSEDVIHSFWVPEFRVKQDALPGGADFVRPLRVTPTQAGTYALRCAELCGRLHTTMAADVVVLPQAEFDAWLAKASGLSDNPAERGQKWSQQFGCISCHSQDGSRLVGPTWQGLYGKQETMTDGSVISADDAYIHESIINPNAKVVNGFPPGVMPAQFIDPVTKRPITDEQIADIIEFIKTLK
ncbi:MAG: cytochrome c oxidase subunit II [Chloroflexota bacterium]